MVKAPQPGAILHLLHQAGIHDSNPVTVAVHGGGNNQVWIIDADKHRYAIKHYPSGHHGERNRMAAESAFLSYAWNRCHLRCVSEPILADESLSMALHGYISGSKLSRGDVTLSHVEQCADFIRNLNEGSSGAESLPPAADACSSCQDYAQLMERRLATLKKIPLQSADDRHALSFIRMLEQAWYAMQKKVETSIAHIKNSFVEQWCVSPSDFGFHNTLMDGDGRLSFIDFEYAGRDDPAKLSCDFFLQPEVPVPPQYFRPWFDRAFGYHPQKDKILSRVRVVFPLLKLHWCCIMLNEFRPDIARRRGFAQQGIDLHARKKQQLEKVDAYWRDDFSLQYDS